MLETTPKEKALIPGDPKTAPPTIPLSIQALIKYDPGVKKLKYKTNEYKSQNINLRHQLKAMQRHYKEVKRKMQAPLPTETVEQLQSLALKPEVGSSKRTPLQEKIQKELLAKREKTGTWQGCLHRITPRFMRHRYQELLNGYIPILVPMADRWKVERAKAPAKVYPTVEARHMRGFIMDGGIRGGDVDENGVFLKESKPKEKKKFGRQRETQ